MKTQSLSIQTTVQPVRRRRLAVTTVRMNSLPCLALMILLSALLPVGLVILATWASNHAVFLPVLQATAGTGGIVFLALAIDAEKRWTAPLIGTAAALFGLTWASTALSAELVIVAMMIAAAWVGVGSFGLVKRNCL